MSSIRKEAWLIEAKDDIERRLDKIEDDHKKAKDTKGRVVKRLRNLERELRLLREEMER